MARIRRFRRLLLNGLTGVSAVVFALLIAVWIRSYWRGDDLFLTYNQHVDAAGRRDSYDYLCFNSECGRATLSKTREFPLTRRVLREVRFIKPNEGPHLDYNSHPASRIDMLFETEGTILTLPYWPLALATAILPAVAVVRIRRRRMNRRAGHCTKCGYDLRASPGRCPECGEQAVGSPFVVN